jgi:hypothetical protein
MNTPRDVGYHGYLGEALKDPAEAAAFIDAVIELNDPASLRVALQDRISIHCDFTVILGKLAKQINTQEFTAKHPPLEQHTRSNLTTEEAAFYLNRRPQTLRAWACYENGPLRPTRTGDMLAWSVTEIRRVLGVA